LAKIDTYDLRFLESSENVRHAIADTLGRKPSADISKGIAVCIQQGRMFFESASNAAMEIRPLLLYYGMMAFSKAVVSGRGFKHLAALSQQHGLRDVSSPTARLAELTVEIQAKGTFQDFNDVICGQEGLDYFEASMSRRHILPTTASVQLNNTQITLKEILAHIPGLESLFLATFREKAQLLTFHLYNHGSPQEKVDLRIDVPDIFEDCHSLRKIVEGLREKYPTLQRWRFCSAEKAWDNSIIIFHNIAPMKNELASANFADEQGGRLTLKTMADDTHIDFRQLLDPLSGGLTQTYPSLATPINGAHISDISLQYAGMFLLSSLVRYRPQIWVHAVSRFASQESPADDQPLALIEGFMDTVQSTYPKLVARLLTQA
jgi:hypothetical protein